MGGRLLPAWGWEPLLLRGVFPAADRVVDEGQRRAPCLPKGVEWS